MILLELRHSAVFESICVADILFVSHFSLEESIDKESFILHSHTETEVHIRVRRVLDEDIVVGIEYMVIILVHVFYISRSESLVALSVLIERPIVYFLL